MVKVTQSFSRDLRSVPAARAFALRHLSLRPGELYEDVAIMVSELATNAVVHAATAFSVTVNEDRGLLRVEVRDLGGGSPQVRRPPPTQPTGRGLGIVRALAHSWGVRSLKRGKVVWFTVQRQDSDC